MKNYRLRLVMTLAIMVISILPYSAHSAETQAKAYFVNLKDGDSVSNPIKVVFGLSGMKVAPAGTGEPNTGHFHLLIDTQLSAKEMKYAISKDAQHMHFGKGETETTLTLTPGKHTLQIVMGDGAHMLHNPPVMSDIITITVK